MAIQLFSHFFAILGVAIFNAFAYSGLQYTLAINGMLLQSATPVVIVVVSYAIFRETITWRQGIGLLLTLIGVAVIVSEGQISWLLGLTFNIGDVWILAAALCWAIYLSVLRRRPALHPLSFLAATFIISVCALLPFYLREHLSGTVMQFNQVTLPALSIWSPRLIWNEGRGAPAAEICGLTEARLFAMFVAGNWIDLGERRCWT